MVHFIKTLFVANMRKQAFPQSGLQQFAVGDFGTAGATPEEFDWEYFDGIAEVVVYALLLTAKCHSHTNILIELALEKQDCIPSMVNNSF